MRIAIADTGPINYLIVIGHIGILPAMFEKVLLPVAVKDELLRTGAPPKVRAWIADPPVWLEVREAAALEAPLALGAGETEAIALAVEVQAGMLLVDDRRAMREACAADSK